MWPNLQFPVDLITFTEKILNKKLYFLIFFAMTRQQLLLVRLSYPLLGA